jgi:pyruvate dehydrogenase E2 component (dihydrolipoamide acetyltransferase)
MLSSKRRGDVVHRGDILATVNTDKALMDVESFDDGVVAELLVEAGTDVAVGAPLAMITGTPTTATVPPIPPEPVPPRVPTPPPEPTHLWSRTCRLIRAGRAPAGTRRTRAS